MLRAWKVKYVDLETRQARRPFYNISVTVMAESRLAAIDRVKENFPPPKYGEYRASTRNAGTPSNMI